MAGGIRMLYVDDEPGLLEVARLFLEETGEFAVTTATSAQEALASPALLSHDAILADYQMPGMDGIAFLKEVRQRSSGIPFILFTGRGREEVVIEAINNGADSYFQKGGDPEAQFAELAHRIHQVVDRRRAEHGRTESEKRLLDIINFLPDATFAIDRSGSVIAWNRAMEEMTGRPAAEMLLKGDHEYAIPFYGARRPLLIDLVFFPQDVVREKYSFVREDGEGLTAETTGATPKGTSCILWGRAAPLINSGGKIYGAIESIRDVTEAKEAEERLHRSEEKFRGMAERTSDLILIIDAGLGVSYVSPSSESIVGYDPEELAGKTPEFAAATVFSPCIPEFMTAVQECMKGMQVEQGGMPVRKKDGTPAFVDMTAIPVIQDGVFSGAQVSLRDVTGRKLAEGAVQESERKFATVFRSSPVALTLVSVPDGKFVDANDTFTTRTGYSRTEIIGRTSEDLGLFADRDEYERFISTLRDRQAVDGMELTCRMKTAAIRTCRFSSRIIVTDGGPHILSSVEDVTDRITAEEALRESEEKYRSLIETLPDMVWEIDPYGKFRYISPIVMAIMGYTPEELAGTPMTDLIPEHGRASAMQELAGKIASEDSFAFLEIPALHRDGRDLILEIRLARITGAGGTVLGFRGVARDMTERRRAEEALRQANRKLGLLSGITRHDIRNQLLALNGFVSYLHKEIPGPKCEHLFSRITAASTKIANLIQFTREYEQLGQNVPVWQDVEKTAKMAAVDLLPDRVRLIVDMDNHEVFADPMFMLVVYNLMDNSLRHGEHVTELAIRFSANEKSGTLVIEDNGAGIPADKKEQIFERGFGKNTGLGLFLIREILAITGVSITETGTEGAGARFEIHLPPGTWRRGPDRAGTMTSLHPVAGTGAEPPRGMPENPGAWTGERNV